MPVRHVHATGKPAMDSLKDVLTVAEVATATGFSSKLIRKAIRRFEDTGGKEGLEAFVPGGPSMLGHTGRAPAYHVTKAELERWFFGQPVSEES